MSRTKITAYVTPDIAETLKRIAAIEDRSMSDIVEDAVVKRLAGASADIQQAAIMASLGQVARRLGAVERKLETTFELTAQATRFVLSVTPEIPEADRAGWSARGRDRLNNMLSVVVAKLADGRSMLQDAYNLALEPRASQPVTPQTHRKAAQ